MTVSRSSLVFTALLLLPASAATAQDRALVILRPAAMDNSACSTGGEPRSVVISNYKLGRQDEVRYGVQAATVSSVSRDVFNRLKKYKLKELSELEIKEGLLYVAMGDGSKMMAVPDVEPERSSPTSITQFMGMLLEGESSDGRTKTKQAFPLNTVWRMFVLTNTLPEPEAWYRHADQEKTVGQWSFFLSKNPGHRVKEANDGLAGSYSGCIDRAMERFRGGSFQAITDAKDHGQRLVAISGGNGPAGDRLAAIKAEEQQVTDLIQAGMQLMKEQKWDDALAAWDSNTKYLKDPSLKNFADAYTETVNKSHDSHIAAANAAVQGVGARGLTYEAGSDAPYKRALQEFEKALGLKPASTQAQQGRRIMTINIALIEARRLRTAKNPGNAREILLKTGKEQGEDPRLTSELTEASCEFSTQLIDQARVVTTVRASGPAGRGRGAAQAPPTYRVRPVATAKEKIAFAEALEKVKNAVEYCQSEDKLKFLSELKVAMADYHVAQAKRALTRKLMATTLLHLKAAQSYQADRADLDAMLTQVIGPVEQRSQILAGVVITSAVAECAESAQQIAGTIEFALVGSGATNVQLLARDQAQGALRQMRSGAPGAQANQAIVSGTIAACTLSVQAPRRQIPSKLMFRNERYEQLVQLESQASDTYNSCRRSYTEAQCAQAKANRDSYRNQKSREPNVILRDYTYEEQTFTANGQIRLTLQVDDTILRGTRLAGEASGSVDQTCTARRGVQDNDWGQNVEKAASGGFLNNLVQSFTSSQQRQVPPNTDCPDVPRSQRFFEMVEQLTAKAQSEAASALRTVARSYYELAKRATDADIAVENYITFALLTTDKSGTEFREALAAIKAKDADLNPEAALR